MKYGVDYIGGAKYPKIALDNHPKGWAIGLLWEVDGFGKADKLFARSLIKNLTSDYRIHLIWKDNHVFTESDIAVAVKKAKEVRKVLTKQPYVINLGISPFLEHRCSLELMTKCKDAVMEVFKDDGFVYFVNTPEADKYAIFKNEVNELHHVHAKPQIPNLQFSYDGKSCLDADVESDKKRFKRCDYFFFWDWSLNCKYAEDDKTPRPLRKLKPDPKLIQSIAMMGESKGRTRFPSNELYKAYAEAEPVPNDHSKPISRSWKPLFIINTKADKIELKVKKQVVATLNYEKAYSHGKGYVYRSTEWGIDIAKKLDKDLPVVNVWVGGKKIGRVNVMFRDGYYR